MFQLSTQLEDLSEVIALIQAAMPDSTIPVSEAFFRWKHMDNPFGQSISVMARNDQGKLIGLRTFMRWDWQNKDTRIHTVRAVDTVTDPASQGQGVFRSLTMKAIELCHSDNISFIFNSPNTKSLPGYLKMGWHVTGRMPLFIRSGSFFPRLSFQRAQDKLESFNIESALNRLSPGWSFTRETKLFHTPMDRDYLRWRYLDCPIIRYGAIIEPGHYGIVFRIKPVGFLIELRICEIWADNFLGEREARKAVLKIIHTIRPAIVTCASTPFLPSNDIRPIGMYGPFQAGPVTTLRPISDFVLEPFEKFISWRPTIGAMELF